MLHHKRYCCGFLSTIYDAGVWDRTGIRLCDAAAVRSCDAPGYLSVVYEAVKVHAASQDNVAEEAEGELLHPLCSKWLSCLRLRDRRMSSVQTLPFVGNTCLRMLSLTFCVFACECGTT